MVTSSPGGPFVFGGWRNLATQKRSTTIHAETAAAVFPTFSRRNVFLMDPDQPKEDPNDLLNRVHHGQMLDPSAMNHNCPFCNKTMAWDLFTAHAEDCFKRWRKVVYRRHRTIGTVVQPKAELFRG